MKTGRYSGLLGAFLICLQTVASQAQSLSLLHSFGSNSDGIYPQGMALCGGILYGTTSQGDNGSGSDSGTVFSICTNGSNYTLLHSFSGSDGQDPVTSPLVFNGWIYGATFTGGSNVDGLIYCMCTNGSNFSVLHTFDDGSGGKNPVGDLLLANGTLYGTTGYGGGTNTATLYSICTNGSNFTVLHTFDAGQVPCLGPLSLSGGTLYGMASGEGSNVYGIVYSIGTNGSNFTSLHQFTAAEGSPARCPVISGSTLFGGTVTGTNTNGMIFSIGVDGSNFHPLHSFAGGSDGGSPDCTLALSSNTLFGVTTAGGNGNFGTVFSINTDGSHYGVIYDFTVTTNSINPFSTLIISGSELFGISDLGGAFGDGTVFGLTLPPPQTGPPFFSGSVQLGNSWNYLGIVGGDEYAFGYYSTLYFPYIYHLDLGWEYYIDANNANHGAYFYDFASGAFFYTEPAIFPYLYDFNQNAWMFCAPQNGAIDRYQSGPRWFLNMSTQVWTNNL